MDHGEEGPSGGDGRRATVGPRGDALERGGGLEHRLVLVGPADYLQADREAFAGEAAGDARGRIAGRVEREAERGPREEVLRLEALRVRRHLADRGVGENAVTAVAGVSRKSYFSKNRASRSQNARRSIRACTYSTALYSMPRRTMWTSPGSHLALPLAQVLDEAARDRALVGHDEEVGGVSEAGVALLHLHAQLLEAGRCPRRRGRDLGVHLRVAEVGAEEDPLPSMPASRSARKFRAPWGTLSLKRSAGSWPAITLSMSAASATVRVIGPR